MSTARRFRWSSIEWGSVTTVAVAVSLAVVIYALREILANPNEGVTNLYAIPIALVAVRIGALGGTVAALISLALFAAWEVNNDDVVVGLIGYVSRGSAFLVLGVIVGRFASERRALVSRLEALATKDPLTGLANRVTFEAELAVELARSRLHGRPAALLFANVDEFKAINDTLGHRVGDQVLKQAADAFRQELRVTDTVGRIGGDEFVFLLPDTTCGDAEAISQKLREAVFNGVREVVGHQVDVGLSVGCVSFDGSTSESAEKLLQAADEAMYRNKASRRT